jgi:outer membrane biosynthesis protein TonB
MRRSSLYTSAAFHALLLMLAIMGLPFLTHRHFDVPQPITVDLIEITKITQTNRVAQPVPPKPEPPKPVPPKPAPAAPNLAPQPAPPVKEPPKPEKIEKPTPPVQQVDENAPPKKEKKVVKKEEPKKQPAPPKDFSSVLKQLDVSNKPPPPVQQAAQQAPLGEKMTMSEADALRSQLEQCWDVPIGAKDVENMTVDIAMVINQDRTLREAHIVDAGRYNSDSTFQALADSALRAVQRCSPFDVPPDKYDTWNTTTVTFNPKDMIQ